MQVDGYLTRLAYFFFFQNRLIAIRCALSDIIERVQLRAEECSLVEYERTPKKRSLCFGGPSSCIKRRLIQIRHHSNVAFELRFKYFQS